MSDRARYSRVLAALLLGVALGAFVTYTGVDAFSREQPGAPAPEIQPVSARSHTLAGQLSAAFEESAGRVSPSIVPIFAEQVVETRATGLPDDLLRQFFGGGLFPQFGFPGGGGTRKQTVHSLGSGVIVSEDGYILTNNHVVQDASKLTVIVGKKRKYEAKVIGTDAASDVGLVKIAATGLPAASLGDSDNVKVGQWVIAVGNPFELMHTVTAGIISARGRSSIGLAEYEDFIQTDASINPGNSGGALADLDGNVIGINTAISTPSGGSVGIGFAIPIKMAKQVMDQLLKSGKVTRGYLGLLPQDIDEDLASGLNLKGTEGALVGDVTAGGPADKAGFRRGDVIVAFGGRKVGNSLELRQMVAQTAPGTKVDVTVLRDGRKTDLTVITGERPERLASASAGPRAPETRRSEELGFQAQTLTAGIARQLGYAGDQGAVVTDVEQGSPADDAGLRSGDLIKEAGRETIRSAGDLQNALGGLRSGSSIALLVRRGDGTFYTSLQIP